MSFPRSVRPAAAPAALALVLTLGAPARAEPPATYVPYLHHETPGGMILELPLSLATRFEDISRYTLDAEGTETAASAMNNQLRVGARFDSKRALVPFLFLAEYEHDLATGTAVGEPDVDGVGLPNHDATTQQLRKLWGRASLGPYLHLGGGAMTSHFGLGLVANDGAHGWTPKSARFIDPRGGDRVLRGFVASGPVTESKLFASVAFDRVLGDDVLLDDDATQLTAAFVVGRNEPTWIGVYGAYRMQESDAGRRTRAAVVDLSGRTELDVPGGTLVVEGELALVFGSTELAGSPDHPEHDLMQQGLALRAAYDAGAWGATADYLFASGDGDLDDGAQRAFKVDPNYSLGVLLFPHLVAAQTGRAPIRAANPEISGYPPDDVDRFATRGSISNAHAFAPRAFYRPITGLELYGGPLFAFTAAPFLDPFETRITGGTPRNAYGAKPGRWLGTELDVGVRWQAILGGTELTLGAEGAVLFPGSAFDAAAGGRIDPVTGARLLASFRL
ncbi:alginate export family protein [Myxococcota bacterium]|nr:alginate export family protein [Myxococcota bacterium]